MKLRQAAETYNDAIEFALAFHGEWNHTPGTGLRELAAIWYRVNETRNERE